MPEHKNPLSALKENLPIVVVIIGVVVGYTKLEGEASESLRLSREAHEWQDDWEKNGQLPIDINQNNSIKALNEKMSKVEGLNLEARLTAIEVNQQNIKADLKKIDAVVLEIRDAVVLSSP